MSDAQGLSFDDLIKAIILDRPGDDCGPGCPNRYSAIKQLRADLAKAREERDAARGALRELVNEGSLDTDTNGYCRFCGVRLENDHCTSPRCPAVRARAALGEEADDAKS